MSRYPSRELLLKVGRTAERSRLLDKALGPLSEPVPPKNAPKIGTRMVFPEDAFVADALNRFPLLQEVPVDLVTKSRHLPHPAKAFGTHRYFLLQERWTTPRVSLLQAIKDFAHHPDGNQRDWWRLVLTRQAPAMATALFPELFQAPDAASPSDSGSGETSGAQRDEAGGGGMGGTGGVPGEEREAKAGRGVGGAGTSAGRELERGSMGEYAAGTGRWWEAEAGGKVHPAARAVLELSEELEPSGIEPPMCNSLLLGLLTDRFGGGSETPVLDYVQLIEDEVLGDALIGQVLLHGKNRAERIPEELYDARLSTGRFGGRGRGRE